METTELLAERGKTHGPYREQAEVVQKFKSTMRASDNWYALTPAQREALEMIAHKIGRILIGDPNVVDHWDDIAGYAKLVSKDIAGPSYEEELGTGATGAAGFIKWNGLGTRTPVTSQLMLPF